VQSDGRTRGGQRVGGRDVGGGPAFRMSRVQRFAVDLQNVRPRDIGIGERPDDLRCKQTARRSIHRIVQTEVDAHTAETDPDLSRLAVGLGDRTDHRHAIAEFVSYSRRQRCLRSVDHQADQLSCHLVLSAGDPAKVGDDCLAGRVEEEQRLPLICAEELRALHDHTGGQIADTPFAIGQRQRHLRFEAALFGDVQPAGVEATDLVHTNRVHRFGTGSRRRQGVDLVDDDGTGRVVPARRGVFGEVLTGCSMPVGRIGTRLDEVTYQQVRLSPRCR
jgi:hypothetical protein